VGFGENKLTQKAKMKMNKKKKEKKEETTKINL